MNPFNGMILFNHQKIIYQVMYLTIWSPRILKQAASLIREAVAEDRIPGAVILVARRGKIILHQAFGHRDLQRTQLMQNDSLFRMASNSKAVTAAGIMLLVEDGKVELDKPIGTYLKAFPWLLCQANYNRSLLPYEVV